MAADDDALWSRLAKLEALFSRAGTEGERDAAAAAIERLWDRYADAGPGRELQFSMPDRWAVRLFVAVCRKHGVEPYRYPRQRRTTVMVNAPEALVDEAIWPEFTALQRELVEYFEETVDHLISTAMRSDGDDSNLEAKLLPS